VSVKYFGPWQTVPKFSPWDDVSESKHSIAFEIKFGSKCLPSGAGSGTRARSGTREPARGGDDLREYLKNSHRSQDAGGVGVSPLSAQGAPVATRKLHGLADRIDGPLQGVAHGGRRVRKLCNVLHQACVLGHLDCRFCLRTCSVAPPFSCIIFFYTLLLFSSTWEEIVCISFILLVVIAIYVCPLDLGELFGLCPTIASCPISPASAQKVYVGALDRFQRILLDSDSISSESSLDSVA
jgi:hypothetical protein